MVDDAARARVDRQPRLHRAASARRCAPASSSIPTSCASTSIPGPGVAWADVRRVALEVKALLDELGLAAGRRRAARAACTSTCASSRAGPSPRCAAPRSRSRARSSGARRSSRPRSGGRRSATASSSTTTRTRRTAPPARRTRCARCPTRASRRRSLGRGAGLRARRLHRRTVPARFAELGDRTPPWTRRPARSRRCSSSRRATRRPGSATRPGRRTSARWRARRRAWRPRARRARAGRRAPRRRRPRHEDAAGGGRELAEQGRRARRPRALEGAPPRGGAQLAVDDVLVDSMRGRSSTWTRIRVNLRNVPEAMRPPQETPDPDDDPTREGARGRAEANSQLSPPAGAAQFNGARGGLAASQSARPAKIAASSCGGTTSSCA